MKLLLDTHVLLWWLEDSPKLTQEARDLIANPENTVFVSAATMWEIRIKQKIGKLDAPNDLLATVKAEEFDWIPISPEHAEATLQLPMLHRDPFDRMLVAQAKWMGLTFLTADPRLHGYGAFVRLCV
jgi:PIN domain nuclease of toxin-antitoxin system